ncbi:efflux RND transporter periplasmic adaptor subunit [Cohnella sp. WQ 127256]|uniref:efflux RND transporter periplasmic adaptor subunit n=1 Tax=Cohnella sp. WQ 127256 TaxID=2938790 RepID=UPI00211777E9|nr:biotin/lipoyl-binding protein [Cohnella sp. WQ 127256]
MNVMIHMDEEREARRKRKIKWIAGLFVAVIITCTLLGNTMLALTLPKVATVEVGAGKYTQTYRGSGFIKPSEERDLTGPVGWTIKEVLVHEGATVHKGQALVRYDSMEARQQIEDEKAALKKLKLTIEKLQYEYIEAAQGEDAAAKLNVKAALESTKIDIDLQQQHIAYGQEKLLVNQTLTAPYDAIVMAVGAKEGLSGPTTGVPDIRLASKQEGFQLVLQVPDGIGSSLNLGEAVEVRIVDKDSRMIQGHIAKMEKAAALDNGAVLSKGDPVDAGAMLLTVSLKDKALQGGEKAELNLVKMGQEGTLHLASTAIRKDSEGTYVFTIEERKGPLGNAFYAVRRKVTVSDASEGTTSISEGLFEQEQVIVESSEPILDGERVRM